MFCTLVPCFFVAECNVRLHGVRIFSIQFPYQSQTVRMCLTACFTSLNSIIRLSHAFSVNVVTGQSVNDAGHFIAVNRYRNNEYAFRRNVIGDITGIILLDSLIIVAVPAGHGEFQGIAVNIFLDNMVIIACINYLDIDIFTSRFFRCMITACVNGKCQFLCRIFCTGEGFIFGKMDIRLTV